MKCPECGSGAVLYTYWPVSGDTYYACLECETVGHGASDVLHWAWDNPEAIKGSDDEQE